MKQIVDSYGRPISSKKPSKGEIGVSRVYDKYSTYPADGLTPYRLARIFKEADAGDVARQSEMFEQMEEKDLHLFSQLQTRKNAVIGLDYELLPYSEEPYDMKIYDFVKQQFDLLEDDIEDNFLDLLDAVGKGFAMSELIWDISEGQAWVTEIKNRHQKHFFWDEDNVMRIMTEENPQGIILPANKYITHVYKAKSGHPSRAGVLRVCSWMYLFKNYTLKDWITFAEVYGMPIRLGKYDPSSSEDDKDALMDALIQIGTDAAGIIPENTEIIFQESNKSSSSDIYQNLAGFCNTEMSKAIIGQTLTSEAGANGNYATANIHNQVRQDLLEADCKGLAKVFKRDFIRPLVYFNFGESKRLPKLKHKYEPPEDTVKKANTYKTIVKDIGLKVPTDHLYKEFSIPEPKEDEPIVGGTDEQLHSQVMKLENEIMVLKQKKPTNDTVQRDIDKIADTATKESVNIFREMYRPVSDLMDSVSTLEELKSLLEDEETVKKLFGKMKQTDIEDMLHKVMFVADLIGRADIE
ncbi:DUF935 domain-containing protein [Vallitalea guaymasensis]|uniref:DUF935 domain-containing protein n=1 Tax=Vallitalea guaymasensis TaxID=1185412 RepID=UPI001FA89BA3|nr:DUF935 domain-containing protein [Vallitalea guaymasensis]